MRLFRGFCLSVLSVGASVGAMLATAFVAAVRWLGDSFIVRPEPTRLMFRTPRPLYRSPDRNLRHEAQTSIRAAPRGV